MTFDLWQWEDSVDEKYPHVVYEERCKAYDKELCEPVVEIDGLDDLEGYDFPLLAGCLESYTY